MAEEHVEVVTRTVGGYQLSEYPSAPVEAYPWRWVAFLEEVAVASGVFCAGPLAEPGRLADVVRLALAARAAHGTTRLVLRERDPAMGGSLWDAKNGRVGAEVDLGPGERLRVVVL